MAKININLDGQKFGRWSVLKTVPRYKGDRTYCLCECECGQIKYVARQSLLNGASQSCGCLAREETSKRSRKDYVGHVFGELTVLEMLYNYKKNGKTYCKCVCSCGNEHIASISNLVTGSVKSCGCKTMDFCWNGRRMDLAGMTFGKLTVIEMLYSYGNSNRTHCKCSCECGKETIVDAWNLLHGYTSSCGCGASWTMHDGIRYKDLTGMKFGMLSVIEMTNQRSENGSVIWKCKCDCGNIKYATTNSLCKYHTTSCGCSAYSNMENFIASVLNENHINYIPQARFNDCRNINPLPFDFYLYDYNILIEYDGLQHSQPVEFFGGENAFLYRQNNDAIKTKYCQDNNINLIRFSHMLSQEEIKQQLIHIWNP